MEHRGQFKIGITIVARILMETDVFGTWGGLYLVFEECIWFCDKWNRERGQLRIIKTVVGHTHNDGDRWRVNQEINIPQKTFPDFK